MAAGRKIFVINPSDGIFDCQLSAALCSAPCQPVFFIVNLNFVMLELGRELSLLDVSLDYRIFIFLLVNLK